MSITYLQSIDNIKPNFYFFLNTSSCFFLHFTILQKYKNKYLNFVLISITIIITLKYHLTYNVERKFHDLQNVNLKNAKPANLIDKKLNGLKWITPHHDGTPENEISQLNEVIEILKLDKNAKMVLTHHQFFSVVLNENLNMVNRWYTNDGNSYPLENSKYSKFYEKHLNDHLKENKVRNIYLIGDENFDDFFQCSLIKTVTIKN